MLSGSTISVFNSKKALAIPSIIYHMSKKGFHLLHWHEYIEHRWTLIFVLQEDSISPENLVYRHSLDVRVKLEHLVFQNLNYRECLPYQKNQSRKYQSLCFVSFEHKLFSARRQKGKNQRHRYWYLVQHYLCTILYCQNLKHLH